MSRPPPQPLRDADLSGVEVLFTDVDGTLTTSGRLRSETIGALEALRDRGLPVVLVSGRPAGWGECWVRTLPVDGAILENGGVSYARDPRGRILKRYFQSVGTRLRNRRRLAREVARAIRLVPGARLSTDSAHTEVDLAIDYNEEVRLGDVAADRLERLLRARGVCAVRSSVHVNCWIGRFDKRSALRRYLIDTWGPARARRLAQRYVYVGDSFNDAPLFAACPLSVGVANVRSVLHRIDAPPRFITRAEEGRGFEELAAAVLRQRKRR